MKRDNRRKQHRKGRKAVPVRQAWFYGLGALGLALLITAAFLAPRLVLELQDNLRCGEVVLGELESMDITSFNTGYETDLYARLLRYAEGLKEGRQYYVTAQELTEIQEVKEIFDSEKGLYQDDFLLWLDQGMISDEVLAYRLSWCKQYVLYGDDFADGVNLLLWYLELKGAENMPVLRLLLDAETGDIYGIRILQTEDTFFPEAKVENDIYTLEWWFGYDSASMRDMWYALGYFYGGLENTEVFRVAEEYGYPFLTEQDNVSVDSIDGYIETPYGKQETNQEILALTKKVKWEISKDGNRLDFLFPYGRDGNLGETSELCFRLQTDYVMYVAKKSGLLLQPKNFTVGFPEIYERIPEFMEDGDG